jgi:hypothetical protein
LGAVCEREKICEEGEDEVINKQSFSKSYPSKDSFSNFLFSILFSLGLNLIFADNIFFEMICYVVKHQLEPNIALSRENALFSLMVFPVFES